ncbi:MAG: Rieske 2Fe-2S domain-containing protein [Marinifilaceae bacterium]
MSLTYKAIHWNRQKKMYDLVLLLLIVVYLLSFLVTSALLHPNLDPVNLIIRATGSLAILLLHLVLFIGPLCRMNTQFLPLLYNRRHLGVTTFTIAAIHGVLSLLHFHGGGDTPALISLFTANPNYTSFTLFPFQVLGFFALLILLLMAATSHDFWLKNLGQKFWKNMHIAVYKAYFLVIMHILLGVIQLESSPLFLLLLGAGMLGLIGLHLWTGIREYRIDRKVNLLVKEGMLVAGKLSDWNFRETKIISNGKSRIAIFRHRNKLSAVSNVCRHQGGPLGEGKLVEGCITCPWHGYQYFPEDGTSPPPFEEKIPTYEVQIVGNKVLVDPIPHPPGTFIPPADISEKKR